MLVQLVRSSLLLRLLWLLWCLLGGQLMLLSGGNHCRDDGLIHCMLHHWGDLGTGVCHNEGQVFGQDITSRRILSQLLTLLQRDATEHFCGSFNFLERTNFAGRSRTS